ncbi:MAG: DMT family transporter [Mesorhizobium sp.]
MALTPNMRGASFMAISQASFTTNDVMVKLATVSIGIGQIMMVRGIFASILMGFLVWRLGQKLPLGSLRHPAVLTRIIGEFGGTTTFLMALSHLPIANVSAVFQALPLAITMTAALFLGEKVGPRRWIAILVGFIGVLIIVRPGVEGFNSYTLYVIACVGFCSVRDLATRSIPADIPSSFMSLVTAATVAMLGAVLIPFTGGWVDMTGETALLLAGAAVFVLIGYQTIIQSMRVGDISFVAPFRYVSLIWAIAGGFLVFGTMPDGAMLFGAAIVVASGLYTLYRERVVGRSMPVTETSKEPPAVDGV